MPATGQNVTVYRGNTRIIKIPVRDTAGAAVSLAGAYAEWWAGIEDPEGTDTEILRKTTDTDAGIEITSDTGLYTLVITLDPSDTAALLARAYSHHAIVTDASGNVVTVTVGTLTLKHERS